MDALGIQRFVVAGHDWGANVAEMMAVGWPERVTRMAMLSTPSRLGGLRITGFEQAQRYWYHWFQATKRGTEAMAHSYAHLFAIPVTMARFFTVYGPWGRPDMALFRFAGAIEAGTPIEVYGEGRQSRDFTYIDDVVEAVVRLLDTPPVAGQSVAATDPVSPVAPWRAVNVAGGRPVELMALIAALERAMGKEAVKRLVPMQAGDMSNTRADTTLLRALTGFVPSVGIDEGTRAFVDWFRTDWARLRAQT